MTREERLDFIQNVAIAVLSVSALFLFTRTEIFRLGAEAAGEYFRVFSESGLPAAAGGEEPLTAPLRLAVTNSYDQRYGDLFLTTADPSFLPAGRLLSRSLEGGDETGWEECAWEDFTAAAAGPSLYCDFLSPLPLSVLAGLLDTSCRDREEARRLILTAQEDGTALYLWDGEERFLRRTAPIERTELEETADRYGPGTASFAMDHREDSSYGALMPLSLLPGRTPSLPVLSATAPRSGTEQLLTALRFNPLTNFRYTESNGTEVVVEGARSVRVRADGSVYYQSGGRGDLSVECAGEVPTLWEAVTGCTRLLHAVLAPGGGEDLYLLEVRQEDGQTVLRFDYHFSGVPIRFSDGRCAAEAVLDGRAVSALELRPRYYAAAEWESLLLPLPQALGVAGMRHNAELSVGYDDHGGGELSAKWMAE